MSKAMLPLAALCFAALVVPATALANATGTEVEDAAGCNVLAGTALGGPRAECLRCVGRTHYHYHSDLPRRQRCHRTNWAPPRPRPHHH